MPPQHKVFVNKDTHVTALFSFGSTEVPVKKRESEKKKTKSKGEKVEGRKANL